MININYVLDAKYFHLNPCYILPHSYGAGIMPYRIAFTGVHGSGKSTTAVKLAEVLSKRYGYRVLVVEVEAIGDSIVDHGSPVERQMYFASKFTAQYLYHYYDGYDYILYTSHPVMTVPYTEYWCKNPALTIMCACIAEMLPKPDLIVHLSVEKPEDYEIIRQRILSRQDRDTEVEANPDYIKYIADMSKVHVRAYTMTLGIPLLEIPARLEVGERVQRIIEYLGVR